MESIQTGQCFHSMMTRVAMTPMMMRDQMRMDLPGPPWILRGQSDDTRAKIVVFMIKEYRETRRCGDLNPRKWVKQVGTVYSTKR